MSESEVTPATGDDSHPQVPLPSVPLGDLLGTIHEAVQAEVNLAVACLAAQQQTGPSPTMPPSSVPLASPATSGKCVVTLWGVVLSIHLVRHRGGWLALWVPSKGDVHHDHPRVGSDLLVN